MAPQAAARSPIAAVRLLHHVLGRKPEVTLYIHFQAKCAPGKGERIDEMLSLILVWKTNTS